MKLVKRLVFSLYKQGIRASSKPYPILIDEGKISTVMSLYRMVNGGVGFAEDNVNTAFTLVSMQLDRRLKYQELEVENMTANSFTLVSMSMVTRLKVNNLQNEDMNVSAFTLVSMDMTKRLINGYLENENISSTGLSLVSMTMVRN